MRGTLRVCIVSGCPEFAVAGSSRCPKHVTGGRSGGDTSHYGSDWRKLRARFLRAYPACVQCGLPATQVDHIIPLSRGGTDDESNLQALCRACHSRKTASADGGYGQ